MTLHPEIEMVTERIIERSRATRGAYLDLIARERESGVDRPTLSCGNFAHGFAAAGEDKACDPRRQGDEHRHRHRLQRHAVGASALRPLPRADEDLRARGRRDGAGRGRRSGDVRRRDPGPAAAWTCRCSAATPSRCPPRSRSATACSTAAALLGICDKIVPGLLIGALRFGHLPALLVPGGPMPSGLANKEKQRIRQLYAEGKVGKDELLEAEAASYHGAGTCTFYGTANSNQMMMELMGLHIPGAAFINPGTPLRQALTRAAVHRLAELGWDGNDHGRSARSSTRGRSSMPRSACSRLADRPTMRSTCRRSRARRGS